MTGRTINETQAKAFAYAFIADIPAYIETHKAAYLAYLEKTGQTDEYYQKNAEAEK